MSIDELYSLTNFGLNIILEYYPQAEKGASQKNFKFRIDSEDTDPNPSCVLSQFQGVWGVYSYRDGMRFSPIDVVMREENLDFHEAVKCITTRLNLATNTKAYNNSAKWSEHDALPDDVEKTKRWKTKELSIREAQTVLSRNTWSYLGRQEKSIEEKAFGSDVVALNRANELFKRYNFSALEYYETCTNGKWKRVSSTETYPIFIFDEGVWQKFYQPFFRKNKPEDNDYRFFSYGEKPQNYVFGLESCTKKHKKIQDPDELDEETGELVPAKRTKKLNEIIIVSGGSDALNIAAFGYEVVWLNSETIKAKDVPYSRCREMAYIVYNLPDMDETGNKKSYELMLEYPDLCTIELPAELKSLFDERKGRGCKDVKDYFNFYKHEDFKRLLLMAYPLRFWEENMKFDKKGDVIIKNNKVLYEYKPDNELIYNFLKISGFSRYKLQNKAEKIVILEKDNIVYEVKYEDIRAYVKGFIREKFTNRDLINTFHKSPQLNDSSLESINTKTINFEDTGRDFQILPFKNFHWKITSEKMEVIPVSKSPYKFWEEDLLDKNLSNFKPKVLAPFWQITKDNDAYGIDIKNKDCSYLRLLMQTSRVHWQKELEVEMEKLSPKDQEDYKTKHKFALDGSNLDKIEIQEQKQHLANKLASVGYLLHRYKNPANSYCIWGMDYNMKNVGQSFGGTGKSMSYTNLFRVMQYTQHNGRNEELTKNQFIFAKVNEHHDLVYIDDASEYFNFKFFFSIVTGAMDCTPKGVDTWSLPFEKSPKLCITSNFPPRDTDSATQRRMWYTVFSDYYHRNPNREYNEERLPVDEFGKSLFTDFDEDDWNLYFNTLAQAIQVWLKFGKIDPPMADVMANSYRNKMGETFHAWADTYFNEDRLNVLIQKHVAYFDYKEDTKDLKLGSQGFKDKLQLWCYYKGYDLNPAELITGKETRIIRLVHKQIRHNGQWQDETVITQTANGSWAATPAKKSTVEHIYIKEQEKPISIEKHKNTLEPDLGNSNDVDIDY